MADDDLKILVIDDDESVRFSLVGILEEEGYSLDEAATGEDGLELIRQNDYDILFSDIRLPGISGVEVLQRTRELKPDIDVVMLTAYASVDVAVNSLNLGSYAFVQKPYEMTQILALIERIAEKRRLQQENRDMVERLRETVSELNDANRQLIDKNKKLKEMDRMKSQFLSSMSHELRTPLNSIIGFADAMADGLCGEVNDKQVRYLTNIRNAGRNLLAIINDLLDLSKIRAGKFVLRRAPFPIDEAAIQSIETVSLLAQNREIDIKYEASPTGIMVNADRGTIQQVFINLLSNAIKFSPDGGKIFVRTKIRDNFMQASVTDEGVGISTDDQKLIFEEFRQVDSRLVREKGGTGLGLAICKNITDLHGGSIWVKSQPGEGSSFYFTLPLELVDKDSEENKASPEPKKVEMSADAPVILVVEDDPFSAEVMKLNLEPAYRVLTARTGAKALELIHENDICLVTLDVMLPDMDGWDVLNRLRSDPMTKDIPVVMVSVVDNSSLGVSLGASDYLIKPVDREKLIQTISRLSRNINRIPRVLVVDDDDDERDLLIGILKGERIDAIGLAHGEDVIPLLKKEGADLILLDLVMPGMSGFDVLRDLREGGFSLPVIIHSAKDMTHDELEFVSREADMFVKKSGTDVKELILDIRAQLESRKTELMNGGRSKE